jgi:hypothetical protein
MAENAQSSPTPPATRTRKVPLGKQKRSIDGQFKLGIWFKNHKFSTMWYMYSDKKRNDYEKELKQCLNMIDVKFKGKVESARIYHVGNGTSGPEVFAFQDDEWFSSAQRNSNTPNR